MEVDALLRGVVQDDEAAMRVDDREVGVADEIGVAGSAADLPDDFPAGGEFGYVLGLVVGNVDIARTVDSQVKRAEELALPAAEAAELADEPPLRREHPDPGVPALRHIHPPAGADCCRGLDLAPAAPLPALEPHAPHPPTPLLPPA